MKTNYTVFIVHAWDYNDHYKDLLTKLAHWFRYNASSPKEHLLAAPEIFPYSRLFLKHLIRTRIKKAHTVLIIAGNYYESRKYPYWMQTELELARKYNKPIIAIRPLGQKGIPPEIQKIATTIAAWNTASIINTIFRTLA
ncbi:MAG: hypothetical protein H6Q67_2291 [Firmicutes bacterium]|nr:hypothetical protein [Bacillota bacterium]